MAVLWLGPHQPSRPPASPPQPKENGQTRAKGPVVANIGPDPDGDGLALGKYGRGGVAALQPLGGEHMHRAPLPEACVCSMMTKNTFFENDEFGSFVRTSVPVAFTRCPCGGGPDCSKIRWKRNNAGRRGVLTENITTARSLDPLPTTGSLAYGAPIDNGVGESLVRDRGTTLSELAGRIAAGGRIIRVVVVELAATGDYLPHIRCSWQPELGYRPISMRRHEGARTWSDYRALRRALIAQGYTGPIVCYPEGHPRLACLRIGVD